MPPLSGSVDSNEEKYNTHVEGGRELNFAMRMPHAPLGELDVAMVKKTIHTYRQMIGAMDLVL